MDSDTNFVLVVPPKFVRNHQSTTATTHPDEAGEYLLRTMELRTGVSLENADILDIGCGTRFAASIINRNISVGSYTGIDIYAEMIEFLQNNTKNYPQLSFYHWDVKNANYNPSGRMTMKDATLPTDAEFDLVSFFSVFTHLGPHDALATLKLAFGALKPEGRIFLTAFIREAQEKEFFDKWPRRPLLEAFYRRDFFESLIRRADLIIERFSPPSRLMAHNYVLRKVTTSPRL